MHREDIVSAQLNDLAKMRQCSLCDEHSDWDDSLAFRIGDPQRVDADDWDWTYTICSNGPIEQVNDFPLNTSERRQDIEGDRYEMHPSNSKQISEQEKEYSHFERSTRSKTIKSTDTRELTNTSPGKKSRMRAPTPGAFRRQRDLDISSVIDEDYDVDDSLHTSSKTESSQSIDTNNHLQIVEERDEVMDHVEHSLTISRTTHPLTSTLYSMERRTVFEPKSILKSPRDNDHDGVLSACLAVSDAKRLGGRRKVRFILDDFDRTYYFFSERLWCFHFDTWIDSCGTMFKTES